MSRPKSERSRLVDNIAVSRRHFLDCVERLAQYEKMNGGSVIKPLRFEEYAVSPGLLRGLFRRHL